MPRKRDYCFTGITAMPLLILLVAALAFQQPTPQPAVQRTEGATAGSSLDYEFFKNRVQPIFLKKRPGHARCIVCHENGTPRLQPLPAGAGMWDDEASRKNFEAWSPVVA